jgi:hypothetical protein
MRYYLDSEFIENGVTIDLISIGIVADDGREYYAINSECDFSKASDWVLENVLHPIGLDKDGFKVNPSEPWVKPAYRDSYLCAHPKQEIARQVLRFTKPSILPVPSADKGYKELRDAVTEESIEFWGEWCSYDWVVLCQLFGVMAELPFSFPMRCRDVIQWKEDHLKYAGELPPSLETDGNHNALLGAKTVKMRYEFLKDLDEKSIIRIKYSPYTQASLT